MVVARGQVVGLPDAAKLLEDLPNKVRDLLGIVVDVSLYDDAKSNRFNAIIGQVLASQPTWPGLPERWFIFSSPKYRDAPLHGQCKAQPCARRRSSRCLFPHQLMR